MKRLIYPYETALIALSFVQMLQFIPYSVFLPLNYILVTLIFLREGCRPHTIVVLFLTFLNTVKASFPDSILTTVLQMIVIVFAAYLAFTVKMYSCMKEFHLHAKHEKKSHPYCGFKVQNIADVSVSIFYPSDVPTGKKARWLHSPVYYKTIYDLVNMDLDRPFITVPVHWAKQVISYIDHYLMDVESNAKLSSKSKSVKVVILSHGLAGQRNGYSTFSSWWAKRGYVVVSVQHDHDEILLNYKKYAQESNEAGHKFIYQCRNRDIKKRANQLQTVFNAITQGGFLQTTFKDPELKVELIEFAGHSYGGGSILQTAAELASAKNPDYLNLVHRLVCLDPWIFPLSHSSYIDNLKPTLLINSQYFVAENPEFYHLHEKGIKLNQVNPKMYRLMIRGMEHLHQCDFVAIGGDWMVKVGMLKDLKNTPSYLELNAFMIYLFEQGNNGNQIREAVAKELDGRGIGNNKGKNLVVPDTRKLWKD